MACGPNILLPKERYEMKSALKNRKGELEKKGFAFKYVRGNAEVGGGYAVYHRGDLVAPGREVTLIEAIEYAEKLNGSKLILRKLLMN